MGAQDFDTAAYAEQRRTAPRLLAEYSAVDAALAGNMAPAASYREQYGSASVFGASDPFSDQRLRDRAASIEGNRRGAGGLIGAIDSFVDKWTAPIAYGLVGTMTAGAAGFGPMAAGEAAVVGDAAAGATFTAEPVEELTLPAISENVITPTVEVSTVPAEEGFGITAEQVTQAGSAALKGIQTLQSLKQLHHAARVNGASGGLVAPGFDRVNPVTQGDAGYSPASPQSQVMYLVGAGVVVLVLVLVVTRR